MSAHAEAQSSRSRLRKRLTSPRAAAVVLGAAVVLVAAVVALPGGEGSTQETPVRSYETTARAEVRDLVQTETFGGTLGYADQRSVVATAAGTLTHVAEEGATVKRGETLYSVDGVDVKVLYGAIPMYRDLSYGVSAGRDVRQLEANLVAMGYGRDVEVDREWEWATTDAVARWEEDLGIAEDGVVTKSDVVFLDGARIVGEHDLEVGSPVTPGSSVAATSSPQRVVTLDVEVGDAELFSPGKRAEVQLPSGETVSGRVSAVGRIATTDEAEEDADPTIEVLVSLEDATRIEVDQASVEVAVETSRAKDVLAVPVAALAATGDGYAVELVEGGRSRRVEVTIGDYADGWVEVEGDGLVAGAKVVTAS